MEVAVLVFFIFPAYLIVRIMLGHHLSQEDRDLKAMQEGIDLVRKRDSDAALLFFDLKIKQNPQSAVAFDWRARAYLQNGKSFEAITDANMAVRLAPSLPYPYFVKAKVLTELEEYEHALREVDKAVWYDNQLAEAYCLRAKLYYEIGNPKKATQDLSMAREYGDEEAAFILKYGMNSIKSKA